MVNRGSGKGHFHLVAGKTKQKLSLAPQKKLQLLKPYFGFLLVGGWIGGLVFQEGVSHSPSTRNPQTTNPNPGLPDQSV